MGGTGQVRQPNDVEQPGRRLCSSVSRARAEQGHYRQKSCTQVAVCGGNRERASAMLVM